MKGSYIKLKNEIFSFLGNQYKSFRRILRVDNILYIALFILFVILALKSFSLFGKNANSKFVPIIITPDNKILKYDIKNSSIDRQNLEAYFNGIKFDYEEKIKKQLLKKSIKLGLENGNLILVNKQNFLERDYIPKNLVEVKYFAKNRSRAGRKMVKRAGEHFNLLSEEAMKSGYEIVVTTAYRDYDFQNNLYSSYVKNHGKALADRFSAKPGSSEHQTGLVADVSSPSVNYELTEDYINTKEGKWLEENAHRFGFIIRYPKDKEDITGYMYEPWHIRYVGKEIATEIFEKDLTLEEFFVENIEIINQINTEF